jgi:hypothetical protein
MSGPLSATDRKPDTLSENRTPCPWCGSPVRVLEGDGYQLTRCRSLRCWWWHLDDELGQVEVQVELGARTLFDVR